MIEQIIPEGFCLSCRGCCRFSSADSAWQPSLCDEEISRMVARRIPPAAVTGAKKARVVPDLTQTNAYVCTFLNTGDNRCAIYKDRPLECRLYPFLLCRRGGSVVLACHMQCPFMKGHFEEAAVKEHIRLLARVLAREEYRAILKNNPHLIQEYPDAVTCVELWNDE